MHYVILRIVSKDIDLFLFYVRRLQKLLLLLLGGFPLFYLTDGYKRLGFMWYLVFFIYLGIDNIHTHYVIIRLFLIDIKD